MADTFQEAFPITKWLTGKNVGFAFMGYVALAVAYGGIAWCWFGKDSAGIFGDMFGAFNAFFTGLSLMGVVGALLLQRQQLNMQAEELQHQREEMKSMVSAQAKTEEAVRKQIEIFHRFAKITAYSALVQTGRSYTQGNLTDQYAPVLLQEIEKLEN